MRKLFIVYRACSKELVANEFNVSRPQWFDKIKCFKSFWNSFGNKKDVQIKVVFDGNSNNLLFEAISGFISKDDIIFLDNVGNEKSLLFCYDLLKSAADSYYIALFEDDYLWLPNSYEILLQGLDFFSDFGSISLYHHPDRVFRDDDITRGSEFIMVTPSCYWRTGESNTATFALAKHKFDAFFDEFVACSIHDRLLFVNLIKKFNFRHFIPISERFGCTHVNRFFPSLFIDWESYNKIV